MKQIIYSLFERFFFRMANIIMPENIPDIPNIDGVPYSRIIREDWVFDYNEEKEGYQKFLFSFSILIESFMFRYDSIKEHLSRLSLHVISFQSPIKVTMKDGGKETKHHT